MELNDYTVIKREVLYQGVFTLARYTLKIRLFAGGFSDIFTREVLERASAAAILPYDPKLDRVILIEQFRPGAITHKGNPWLTEIPAGIIESLESPCDVAAREAKEEANCEIKILHPLCEYFVSPGGSNEYLNLYCGYVDAKDIGGFHGLLHEQEDIRVLNLSAEEAFLKLSKGEIQTAPAIVALLWLQLNKDALKQEWGNL